MSSQTQFPILKIQSANQLSFYAKYISSKSMVYQGEPPPAAANPVFLQGRGANDQDKQGSLEILLDIAGLPELLQLDVLILDHVVVGQHVIAELAVGEREGRREDEQPHRDADVGGQDEHSRQRPRDHHVQRDPPDRVDAQLREEPLHVLPEGLAEALGDELGVREQQLRQVAGRDLRQTLHHARIHLEGVGHLPLPLLLLPLPRLRHAC